MIAEGLGLTQQRDGFYKAAMGTIERGFAAMQLASIAQHERHDPAGARGLYELAAECGNPIAQHKLAWMREKGLGGGTDLVAAEAGYREAGLGR